MKPPRVTVGRLMILVAVVGLAMGAEVTRRRWKDRSFVYSLKAAIWEYESYCVRNVVYGEGCRGPVPEPPAWTKFSPERRERLARHYEALSRKYDQAASRPWASVEPDPSEPE